MKCHESLLSRHIYAIISLILYKRTCLSMGKSVMKVIDGNDDFFSRFEYNQLDKGKAAGTVAVYLRELRRLDGWLRESGSHIEDITRYDVQAYVKALQAGDVLKGGRKASVATIDRIFGTISVLAKYLNRPYIVEDIRKPKKQSVNSIAPKSLDRNEINRLLRDVERDGNLRNIAFVNLMAFTGLRVSEAVSLTKDNVLINERNGSAKVIGKGNKERTVPLTKEVRRHLKRYLDSRTDDEEALFLSNYGRMISVRSAQRIIEKYGFHAHELRHTFCRNLIRNGTDIVTVAQLAGHESIETTRRYAMASEADISEQLDNLFN